MAHHLFIVSRHNSYLAEYLRERFSGEAEVRVFMDRRRGDRRRSDGATTPDRRRADRRSRPQVDADLRSKSHAFVTLS
ncbi:MAG: hypothetical protein AAB418_09770 [candidate division NC10 bacterium]|jgi:hypothetical protein